MGSGWLAGGGIGSFGFSASADFLNSADFSYEVLDDQLNPLRDATVIGGSGFVYADGRVTVTPEPAPGTLLGVGLVVILIGANRGRHQLRRRRA